MKAAALFAPFALATSLFGSCPIGMDISHLHPTGKRCVKSFNTEVVLADIMYIASHARLSGNFTDTQLQKKHNLYTSPVRDTWAYITVDLHQICYEVGSKVKDGQMFFAQAKAALTAGMN